MDSRDAYRRAQTPIRRTHSATKIKTPSKSSMNDSQTSDRTSSMNITNYFKKSSQPPNSSVTLDGTSSLFQTTGQGTSAEAVPYNFRPENANESLGSHSRPSFLPKTTTTKQVGMSDNIPRKASQWSQGQHTPTPKSRFA